jgi:Tfp pilus assembly protein PilF
MADCRAHLVAAPDDADTHGLLGLLLQENDRSEEAREHIDAALRQNPKQLDAMLASATIQADARQYDAASHSFAALLEAHPKCGRAWHGLATIELSHMQLEAAKRHIELAAAHIPEQIGTGQVLAWIELLRGDVAAAEVAFERCMALDRTFGETHGGLAVVAALQGREDAARASIKRALRLDQQSRSAQYAQMLLLQRDGKHGEAQAILDAVQERRLARADTSLRDMVATHIEYLQARASDSPDDQGMRP